jgi:hypothetical protein
LVAEEVVDDLLDNADTSNGATIWSAMRPLSEALGGFATIAPIETAVSNVYLIPGDIRLSEFESDLNEFWAQCLQRKMRGFRGTTALSELVTHVAGSVEADYVFYDSGPNIGPLNRAILLDCDHFIVPVACDLFSVRALKTLGRTLADWIRAWSTISQLAPEETYLLPGQPAFLGYILEGFKVYGGTVAHEYSNFLPRIEKEIHAQIIALLSEINPALATGRLRDFKLGEIKNFGGLLPASQTAGLPLYEVKAGSQDQRDAARKALSSLAAKIDAKVFGSGK